MPDPIDHGCAQRAGTVYPVIDRNRCEGKAECVAVCPVQVFDIGVLPLEARRELSLRGRVTLRYLPTIFPSGPMSAEVL